ncbi:MAG: trypsin-like peptidase domain-containing protein [Lachnospiraceae bacterium]|nr:trypsin-like peptidase domain-containing protein [Lachnospiraceae bacterium]
MRKQRKLLRGVAAVVMALCMVCTLAVTTLAASTSNAYVTSDTTGVLQVRLRYTDKNSTSHDVSWGTGFLINDDTLITCYHVLSMTDTEAAAWAESAGMTVTEFKDRLYIDIVVLRDVTVTASVINYSDEMDFAILSLDTPIYNRTYLTMRPTSEVQQTETVYALGFPAIEDTAQDAKTYTSDDVTITSGVVNKLTTYNTVDYIMHTATLTSGNSGGPLVDAEGNVIGICQSGWSDGMDVNYYYSIATDELIDTLDALGIEFTLVDDIDSSGSNNGGSEDAEPEPEPEPEPDPDPVEEVVDKTELAAAISDAQQYDEDDYTSESFEPFKTALTNAQNVNYSSSATQSEVNAAITNLTEAQHSLVEKSPLPIIPIAVGAVVLVVVIIIIVVVSARSKKKKKAAPIPAAAATPYAPVGGGFTPTPAAPVSSGFTPVSSAPSAGETSVLGGSAGETSVLGGSAGETTLLGGGASYGKLTRTKTGETISINNANFIIGREKSQVNYCVADNTSVGRRHAKISGRGGAVYLTDLKSTNGTYINGVKQNANQEVQLNNGDKITLADEEFVYSSF